MKRRERLGLDSDAVHIDCDLSNTGVGDKSRLGELALGCLLVHLALDTVIDCIEDVLNSDAGLEGGLSSVLVNTSLDKNAVPVVVGDLVDSVRLARPDGTLLQAPADRMEFEYDYSRLKHTGEIVLWAAFKVTPGGDPVALRAVARESLAFRKSTQPLESPSAGCVFMNPDRVRDRIPDGIPPSAGALVDRAGLKGVSLGGARVSPTHANFIIAGNDATAADICALVERCRSAVKDQFGVTLRNEIMCLGEFDVDIGD